LIQHHSYFATLEVALLRCTVLLSVGEGINDGLPTLLWLRCTVLLSVGEGGWYTSRIKNVS
jgi:hypothetical protein